MGVKCDLEDRRSTYRRTLLVATTTILLLGRRIALLRGIAASIAIDETSASIFPNAQLFLYLSDVLSSRHRCSH